MYMSMPSDDDDDYGDADDYNDCDDKQNQEAKKCLLESLNPSNANLSYFCNIRNFIQYGLSKYAENNSHQL